MKYGIINVVISYLQNANFGIQFSFYLFSFLIPAETEVMVFQLCLMCGGT